MLRFLFIFVGLVFITFGLFSGELFIVPFGLLTMLGAGLKTQLTATRDPRHLTQRNSVWGLAYHSTRYTVHNQSVLIGLTDPAGNFGGDGIAILDSYSLQLEDPRRKRTPLLWGYNSRHVLQQGRDVATLLGIEYREEIG